jgi:catechol 2,3-dioxygenase-like lactoylglutathione lyase family enzyme
MKKLLPSLLLALCPLFGQAQSERAPVMLDDIHYYMSDRDSTNRFFIQHFGARPMAQQPTNPFAFIDFLLVRPGQSTINVSARGPFPGMRVRDPKRWNRELVPPSADLPPMLGMHWLAFGTKNLKKAVAKLEQGGVKFVTKKLKLAHDPKAKAALCWGPDYTLIAVVERKADSGITPFAIDHLQYLVDNLDAHLKFFTEVYDAKVISRQGHTAVVEAGKHTFVVSEPEGLGLARAQVAKRDPNKFRYGVDHLGFMYTSIAAAHAHAAQKGYPFALNPVRMQYNDQPTVYTFAITATPDGMQMEMYQEDGRTAARAKYLDQK